MQSKAVLNHSNVFQFEAHRNSLHNKIKLNSIKSSAVNVAAA